MKGDPTVMLMEATSLKLATASRTLAVSLSSQSLSLSGVPGVVPWRKPGITVLILSALKSATAEKDIARSGVAPGIYRLEPADVTVDVDHRACTSLAHKTADVEG